MPENTYLRTDAIDVFKRLSPHALCSLCVSRILNGAIAPGYAGQTASQEAVDSIEWCWGYGKCDACGGKSGAEKVGRYVPHPVSAP